MRRSALVVTALLSAFLPALGITPAHAGPAMTDTSYFDGFPDLVGIDPFQSSGIELDALGGVRMKGNGASEPKAWTSQEDFESSIFFKPVKLIDNPLIPLATLDAVTTPGSLLLPATPHAFRRVSPEPVLLPAPAVSVDGYGVAGMCVRRVDGSLGKYYMWYTGVPESEYSARIYLATSEDGITWDRQPQYDPDDPTLEVPVLDLGTPGSFDSRQLGKPSVVYDAGATPKFKMWYSAEGDLVGSIGYATSEDGVVWTKWVQPIVTLDGADADVGQHASLAVGADGLPIVAYYDATSADLKVFHCGNAFCSDGNTIVTLDAEGDVGRFASLAVAGDGLPVVAYYDATNGDLKVAHCGTAACTVGNVVTTVDGADLAGTDVGMHASLAVDANGYPLIAYHDFTNRDLKFVGCTDYACAGGDEAPATVDGAAAEVGEFASLALVARDPLAPTTLTPAIAYYDATSANLKYVACNDSLCSGGDENPATLDPAAGVGTFASLAVGPDGLPAVAYYDATADTLRFVACNDALCSGGDEVPVVPDPTTGRGTFSRLAFGAGGLPVIGYYDATNGDLLMIECNDALCSGDDEEPVVVDDAGNVGQDLSLAVLPGGLPHFAYYDADNGDLKFTASRREPLPVLGPGIIGSFDSFSVAHPSVIFDGGIYRMWYTANDSNNKRVAYASSIDGVTWTRGGLVVDLQNTANDKLGAWAPSVTKTDTGYWMVYTGWKPTSAGDAIDSKLLLADSVDGTTWQKGSVSLNNGTGFDRTGLSQGSILYDPLETLTDRRLKMWYVGNAADPVTGADHERIGLAAKRLSGGTWTKLDGGGGYLSVFGLGAQGAAFDSMSVFDLRVVPDPADPAGRLFGFYTGRNAADFKDRIGVVESLDGGESWGDVASIPDPLLEVGGTGTPSESGVPTAAPVFLGAGSGWLIYHTALDASLAPTLGLHTAPDELSSATSAGQVTFAAGGTCPAFGSTDPFVTADGTALTLFYAGLDADDTGSICVAAGSAGTPLAFGAATQILAPGPDAYDAGGLRRPVAWLDPATSTWQLWYTAVGVDGVERIAHASFNGSSWVKTGLAVLPSTAPHDFAEQGVWPGSAWTNPAGGVLLAFTGIDRFGWGRTGLLAAAGAGHVEGATATFQTPDDATLADAGYLPRDWRAISWNPPEIPPGSGLEVWVSYYPTYSGLWSNFFRVDNGADLPFLLTVRGMRWQLRAAGDPADVAVTPQLDDLAVDNAAIAFPATATAATLPIGPAAGWYLLTWGDLTVKSEANGGTLSVRIADQEGTTIVADQPVTGTEWVYTLDGSVPVTSGRLQLFFTFTPGAGTPPGSPLLKSVNVTFTSTDVPSELTLTGTPNPLPYYQTATVSGWLTSDGMGLEGQTITLKKRLVTDTVYTEVTTAGPIVTLGDGSFSVADLPQADDTVYRAEWPGGEVLGTPYPPASTTFVLQMAPATLAFSSAANPVMYGKATTLKGTLVSTTVGGTTPLVGETVTLRWRLPSSTTYTDLGTAVTLADGSFAFATPVKPAKNTLYQATWRSKASVEFTLWVRTAVSINLTRYAKRVGKWHYYPLGSALMAAGAVAPNHRLLGDGVTTGRVKLTAQLLSGTWKNYRAFARTLSTTSIYKHLWKPTVKGKYRIRTTFNRDVDHIGGVSPYRYFIVY